MAKAAAKLASISSVKCALLGVIGMLGLLVSAIGPFKVPFAETLAKTYYRQAVMGLVIVTLAVTALVTAVVELFDPNQFKDQLVRWVHERTQRDLVLDGALKMSYFPRLGIESGRASLSQRRSAREFASIERAQVTLAWLPLLRGQMRIHSAEVEGLRAQIVRFKDGSTNIDDLARDLATIDAAQVELDSLRLTRGSLQWNDELVWQRGHVAELQLDLGHVADGVAGPLAASGRVDAPAAGIDARAQLKGRLLFDAAAGRVELARIDAQLDGKALGIDNLGLHLKGDVTALPRERVLNAENLALASTHKTGLSVIHTALALPELKAGEYKWTGSALQFDASLTHPDRSAALVFKVPRFEWAERALRETTAQAQLTLKGGAGVALHATASGPVALALDGGEGPRLELAALELNGNASHPALAGAVAAQLKGRLEFQPQQGSLRSAWTGRLAGQELKADVALAAEGGRPRWTVEAELARLDLDALLAGSWRAHLADDATAFDASGLREAASLRGGVRIGQLGFGGEQLAGLNVRVELQRSLLQMEPITAQLHGAPLEAALLIDAAAASTGVVTKGRVGDLELRDLLGADAGAAAPPISGRGTLAWDLSSTGGSIGTLRDRLTGTVQAALRGGALAGIDLRAALLEARAETGKRSGAWAREFNGAAMTPFDELKATIELREGRARAQALELSAPALRATGEGDLWLDSGTIELRLQAGAGKGAAGPASLPLQVQGPWRAPRFEFNLGAGGGVAAALDAAPSPITLSAR